MLVGNDTLNVLQPVTSNDVAISIGGSHALTLFDRIRFIFTVGDLVRSPAKFAKVAIVVVRASPSVKSRKTIN